MKISLVVLIVGTLLGIAKGQYGYSQQQRDYERNAGILRYENINNGDGTYQYNYETSNGLAAEESGFLRNPGTDYEVQTVRGSYQYYSPEGQLIRVVYTADENGFVPQGDHLPTPPPIPPEIQKSLDIIYANIDRQQQQGSGGYNSNNGYSGRPKSYNNNKPSRRY